MQGRGGVSQGKERRGERVSGPGRGNSKGRGESGFLWPSLGDRKFDGEGAGKEGRRWAIEPSLRHPHLWK